MSSAPLLDDAGACDRGEEIQKKWWEKVVDLEEAKQQVRFFVPMIVTIVSYYSITLVSVMFAGHLGDLELAGSTLGNSWATVTGLALMVRKSLLCWGALLSFRLFDLFLYLYRM